jgi:hypothetical protein
MLSEMKLGKIFKMKSIKRTKKNDKMEHLERKTIEKGFRKVPTSKEHENYVWESQKPCWKTTHYFFTRCEEPSTPPPKCY